MTGWWTAAFVAQWVVVLVLSVVVVALARQMGTLHLRLGPRGALEVDTEGPALGEAVPPTSGIDATGASVTVGGPGSKRLVLFSSPTCPICEEVAPGVPVAAAVAGLTPLVLSDPDMERAWDVPGTPFMVILDELGIVRAKGTVNNLEQVEGLVDVALRRIEEPARWAS